MRLKPVPTGSTKTRSVKASHDSRSGTSRGGIVGSVPSAGNATRCGPTAPMCRYADEAPGPPLKTNVTGRSRSRCRATYETEKISAAASPSCAGRSTSRSPCRRRRSRCPSSRRRGAARGRACRRRFSSSVMERTVYQRPRFDCVSGDADVPGPGLDALRPTINTTTCLRPGTISVRTTGRAIALRTSGGRGTR